LLLSCSSDILRGTFENDTVKNANAAFKLHTFKLHTNTATTMSTASRTLARLGCSPRATCGSAMCKFPSSGPAVLRNGPGGTVLQCASYDECKSYFHPGCSSTEDPTRCGVCVFKAKQRLSRVASAVAPVAATHRPFVPLSKPSENSMSDADGTKDGRSDLSDAPPLASPLPSPSNRMRTPPPTMGGGGAGVVLVPASPDPRSPIAKPGEHTRDFE